MTEPASSATLTASVVVARRGRWIGTPYRHQASCRGAGTDCLGLLRGLWREMLGRRAGGGAGLYRRTGRSRAGREDLLAAAARHLVAGRRGRRGRATSSCSGCARAGSRSMSASWRASPLGHPTLIHAYSGHGVVESPLTPAWSPADRRGFPLSREERLMATLLLSAAGSALGGALGRRASPGSATAVLGKAIGATLGVGDRPAAARGRLRAGRDRPGRAVPGDGLERGRADRAGLRAGAGRGPPDLVEPLPRDGERGGGRRQGWRRTTVREYSYSVSLAVALCEGPVLRDRADLGRRDRARPVGRGVPAASGHRGRSCPIR